MNNKNDSLKFVCKYCTQKWIFLEEMGWFLFNLNEQIHEFC